MHRSAIRMVQQVASLGLLFAAVFVVRAFAEDKPGDLPPEGLTERHCTVGPSNVVSRLTTVLVGPGAVRYIPREYKDKWMLKVSAAPAKKRRNTARIDWRMTYGLCDTRKQVSDECEKCWSRIDKVIKARERKEEGKKEKEQVRNERH